MNKSSITIAILITVSYGLVVARKLLLQKPTPPSTMAQQKGKEPRERESKQLVAAKQAEEQSTAELLAFYKARVGEPGYDLDGDKQRPARV